VREGWTAAFGPADDGVLRRGTVACVHVGGERAREGAVAAGHLGSLSLGPAAALGAGGRKWLRRGSIVLAAPPGAGADALPALARALLPSRFVAFAPARGGDAAAPWARRGAAGLLTGASGLRVAVVVADRDGEGVTLEVVPVDYVEEGPAVLTDAAGGAAVVGRTEFKGRSRSFEEVGGGV